MVTRNNWKYFLKKKKHSPTARDSKELIDVTFPNFETSSTCAFILKSYTEVDCYNDTMKMLKLGNS